MKLLFLRAKVPTDRPKQEIMYTGLCGNDDMWEHLACELGYTRTEIVYWGGNRTQRYTNKDTVCWVEKTKHYKADFKPDVIFARGGFEEWKPILKRYPNAVRIYYGAGDRIFPEDHIKYDIILVDSAKQLEKGKCRGLPVYQWVKPAAPIFRPIPNADKPYDAVYVGDGRFPFRAKIKNVNWVYKTVPKDIRLLHLGWSGAYKPPANVTVKRVTRDEMPAMYAKCRVGVVPYRSYDSAPRVIPEMSAMGLPVLVSEGVNYANGCYPGVYDMPLDKIWEVLRSVRPIAPSVEGLPTIEKAAIHIRSLINGLPPR